MHERKCLTSVTETMAAPTIGRHRPYGTPRTTTCGGLWRNCWHRGYRHCAWAPPSVRPTWRLPSWQACLRDCCIICSTSGLVFPGRSLLLSVFLCARLSLLCLVHVWASASLSRSLECCMQGAKRLEVDIQYVENWIQTSWAVAAAHRRALLELPIFSKCRQVLALLLPPKLTPEVLYCSYALPM